MLRPGDHVVIPNDAYGGTFRLIDKVFTLWGVELHRGGAVGSRRRARGDHRRHPVGVGRDPHQSAAVDRRHRGNRRDGACPWGERCWWTTRSHLPRCNSRSLLGADVVLHSTTKYIGGHSDVVGGALLTNDEELDTAFGFLQNGAGAVPGPFDAYLTVRGLKTLVVRMQRHSDNARRIAVFLAGHPAVEHCSVSGPARASRARDRGQRQMSGFGGMISVRLHGGRQAALDCVRALRFSSSRSRSVVSSR